MPRNPNFYYLKIARDQQKARKRSNFNTFWRKIRIRSASKITRSYSHPKYEVQKTRRNRYQKSMQKINLLKLLSGTNWGCSPKTIMRLYKAFVKPVLEYGAIFLLSVSPYQLKQLQNVQHRAIKITYRLPWRARTNETHAIAGIEPLRVIACVVSTKLHCASPNYIYFE